jgi:hypothetical protein
MFSLQQNWRRGGNKFCLGSGGGEVDQTLHTHVSKCTNNKIKGEKNQNAILM